MSETEERPNTRKLILFGVAIAVPLAAVALYFAIFDQPPPASRSGEAPAVAASPQGVGEKPALPPDHPPVSQQQQVEGARSGAAEPGAAAGMPASHPQMGGAGRTVRIPDAVKDKWQAVKLQVEQKSGEPRPQVFTVKLGGELDIPGSKLQVKIGDFLPALQVNGNEVTSMGNDPTNPAVLVTVSEGGKEIFRGWLFGKFPDMQPFVHPMYKITLLAGVPKG